MSRPALISVAFALLVACGGDAPAGDGRPPAATILAHNLELLPGGNALRIGFEPAGSNADVIVTAVPDTATIVVCALEAIDDPLPPRTACRVGLGSGVREPVSASGLGALTFAIEGEPARANILIEFPEGGRRVEALIPLLRGRAGPCEDNACNPFFEMLPTRNGPFTASVRWDGPPATLRLLQGTVIGRSQTATGLPYRVAAEDEGVGSLAIASDTSAPGEYALTIAHRTPGGAPLRDVRLEAAWPTSS